MVFYVLLNGIDLMALSINILGIKCRTDKIYDNQSWHNRTLLAASSASVCLVSHYQPQLATTAPFGSRSVHYLITKIRETKEESLRHSRETSTSRL